MTWNAKNAYINAYAIYGEVWRAKTPAAIIVNPGGRKTVRPTYVTRIEIDELMRPVIHTNCGFGLWGDRIFPDRTSAEKKIVEKEE